MKSVLTGFDAVERDTLQERIYRQIHHKLLTGQLLPGQQLSINALINALGGSAMPIREALRRLEAERLLVVGSNRSLTVPRLNAMQVAELRDMRLALEGMATERAVQNIAETDLTSLAAICAEMEEAIRADDPVQYLDA